MIDLSCWNLTIPIGATVIPTKVLNAGYQDPYFKRLAEYIDFIADSSVPGAKSTPNSDYPRCELRFTLPNGDDKEANWKIASAPVHVLAGRCAIMEGPRSGKLIFAQWHGDGNHPGFKGQGTRQADGTWNIYAQLRRKLDGSEDKVLILKGLKQGETFTYRFELTGAGLFKAFINGTQVVTGVLLATGFQFDLKSYAKDTWYPKAGVYSQEKVGGQGRGWVRYFELKVFDGEPARAPTLGLPMPTTPEPEQPTTTSPVPVPATPTLNEQITAAFDSWKVGTLTAKAALTKMNAYSKQVASIPSDKDRAPLYAQINAAKALIGKGK